MVNSIYDLVGAQPSRLSEVSIAGGIDAETGWQPWNSTNQWAEGYDSVNEHYYYDFGDASGCPTDYASVDHLCGTGWYQSDVVDISWLEPPAIPFPQLYRRDGSNAAQWQALSSKSWSEFGGGPIHFAGVLTQAQACADAGSSDTLCSTHTTDNPPDHGWGQFWLLLNRDPNTPWYPNWSTDITKIN